MWPRILLEILPHLTRLVPAADKFLASRNASDKAQEEALAALADHVRGGISGVTEEQAGLRRQLQEQSEQIGQVGVEVTRTRLGVENIEARITKLEQVSRTATRLQWVVLVLVGVVAGLAVVILVKGR